LVVGCRARLHAEGVHDSIHPKTDPFERLGEPPAPEGGSASKIETAEKKAALPPGRLLARRTSASNCDAWRTEVLVRRHSLDTSAYRHKQEVRPR
jgi:hypothetical protein